MLVLLLGWVSGWVGVGVGGWVRVCGWVWVGGFVGGWVGGCGWVWGPETQVYCVSLYATSFPGLQWTTRAVFEGSVWTLPLC